ncbi:hypothetical protein P3W75_29415 [Pseudomonas citronellolis]|nr:hypothetical protein [Pseudomonas citronellolis]MDF3936769.1 hypothetical protein [Pseudomonas citronellolis]
MLTLAGCAGQQPQTQAPAPTPQPGASGQAPAVTPSNKPAPRKAITPNQQNTSAKPRSRPQFAPPPGGKGRWDAGLGVYVIQGEKDLYYRQRTYYHWDSGWFWGVGPQGPWTATDSSGVPPGLNRRYATP